MKNLYIYGASDDLHEVDSDFGTKDEFYGDAMLNKARITWNYDSGDWKITIDEGNLPHDWKVKRISGTSDVIHIQIPEGSTVRLKALNDWAEIDNGDIPGYLMDELVDWLKEHDIDSIERYHESFQMDSFHDDVQEKMEDVVKAVLEYK